MKSGTTDTIADVVIVGAGLAGATAAAVLQRAGTSVVLVDPHEKYRVCFKAEKIEPDQAALMRTLGVLDMVRPWSASIREVENAHAGRVMNAVRTEQYGVFYHDMVNAIRQKLTPAVDFRLDRVDDIVVSDELQRVTLASGETIHSRVVVLADGGSHRFDASLSLRRRMISERHSLSFGFTIQRNTGRRFPFDALTYFADRIATHIDFLTLFPIRDVMRANLFVYRELRDPWVRSLVADPVAALSVALPGLVPVIGEYSVVSKVETGVADLSVTEVHDAPGVVLIGDAFQTVCPATGTGLSKVLTDVDLLCRQFLPEWLATPGTPATKIAAFYAHPRKTACDEFSARSALYRRSFATDAGLRWHIHRKRTYIEQTLAGWSQRARHTRAS